MCLAPYSSAEWTPSESRERAGSKQRGMRVTITEVQKLSICLYGVVCLSCPIECPLPTLSTDIVLDGLFV